MTLNERSTVAIIIMPRRRKNEFLMGGFLNDEDILLYIILKVFFILCLIPLYGMVLVSSNNLFNNGVTADILFRELYNINLINTLENLHSVEET